MGSEEFGSNEFASSPCYAHEFEERITNGQIIDVLTQLLEGERAGARVAKESGVQAEAAGEPKALVELIDQIYRDEVFYCKMLIGSIESLGGVPSNQTGAFYEKCMSIADLGERLAFLNRGQGWVSRKLAELIPQLRDAELIAALQEMRKTHDSNIEKTNIALEPVSD